MVKDQYLQFIYCCFNLEKDEHFVETPPIVLSCGHHVCKTCIPKRFDEKTIICSICSKINSRFLNLQQFTPIIDVIIQDNIGELMQCVSQQFETELFNIKHIIGNLNENITNKTQFIREEIEIKIQSLISELEKLKLDLYERLDKITEIQKNTNNQWLSSFDISNFENDLKQLNSEIDKKVNFVVGDLNTYQNKVKQVRELIRKFNKAQSSLHFKINDHNLDKLIIGKIEFNMMIDDEDREIMNRMKSQEHNTFKIEHFVNDICVLPNGLILVSEEKTKKLFLYKENFKLLKTIEIINGHTYSPVGLATNGQNEIYIADFENKRIIKSDLEFNLLGISGDKFGPTQFQPARICYNNKIIYASGWNNKKVCLLDSDSLDFKECYKFDYSVWHIKVIDNIACVRDRDNSALYFYNLPGFVLKQKHDGHSGIIGINNGCFYEFDCKTFYCYKSDGSLIESIKVDDRCFDADDNSGAIVGFNTKLLMKIKNSDYLNKHDEIIIRI